MNEEESAKLLTDGATPAAISTIGFAKGKVRNFARRMIQAGTALSST
jgi:hypothetical protein